MGGPRESCAWSPAGHDGKCSASEERAGAELCGGEETDGRLRQQHDRRQAEGTESELCWAAVVFPSAFNAIEKIESELCWAVGFPAGFNAINNN